MKIRTGRFIVCTNYHTIGSNRMQIGVRGQIIEVGDRCKIIVKNRTYNVSENLLNNCWGVDVKTQLKQMGMPEEYVKKIGLVKNDFVVQKYLNFDNSGLSSELLIEKMTNFIDNCWMNFALS